MNHGHSRKYGALSSFDLGEEIDAYVPANSGRLWGVTGRLVGVRHTLDGDERVTRVTVELGVGQLVRGAGLCTRVPSSTNVPRPAPW